MRYFSHKWQTFSRATLNFHHVHQCSPIFHLFCRKNFLGLFSRIESRVMLCYQCRPRDEIVFSVGYNVQTAKFLKIFDTLNTILCIFFRKAFSIRGTSSPISQPVSPLHSLTASVPLIPVSYTHLTLPTIYSV